MTTLYAAELTDIQQEIDENGAAVAFARQAASGSGYNASTGITTGADTVAASSAIDAEDSPSRYKDIGHVVVEPVNLLVAASSLGSFVPQNDDIMLWAGVRYAVKDVKRVAPDGTALLYDIVGGK